MLRRRKRRIKCPVDGCGNEIIYDRLMCRRCWLSLPIADRKAHIAIWRELRPFVERHHNQLRNIDPKDRDHVLMLIERHHQSCSRLKETANKIHRERGLPSDDGIEDDLKRLGLI